MQLESSTTVAIFVMDLAKLYTQKRACMHISRDSSPPHHLLQLTSQALVLQDQLLCSALWYPMGRLAGLRTLEGPDRLYYIQTLEVLRHTCFAVVNPSLA